MVQEALRTSYPIDPEMDEMVTATLATAWQHIRDLQCLMKRLDQHIALSIAPIPSPLITVRGSGAAITAGLLAEIVDIARFPEHQHVAQYVGLTWEKRSSGNFVSQNTRMTKVGNVCLRYYLILGADKLRQFNLEYQAYYFRKYHEGLQVSAQTRPRLNLSQARASGVCSARQESTSCEPPHNPT
jgi:transposase